MSGSSDDDCYDDDYESDGFGEYDGTYSEVELEDDEVVDESESHDDQHSYQLEDINNNGNDSIIMDTHLNYWLICHYS